MSCPGSDVVAPAKYRCRRFRRSFRRAALKEQAWSGRALTFVSVPWTARPSLLLGQPKAVAFPELLASQCRSEIGVALPNQAQGMMCQILGQLMVARVATALRKQPGRASCTIPGDQPFNLSSTDPKPLCGSPRHPERHALAAGEPVVHCAPIGAARAPVA